MSDHADDAPRLSIAEVLGELDPSEEREVLKLDPRETIPTRASEVPPLRSAAYDRLEALRADPRIRFATQRELGRGGMGVVHLAEQISLGRRVALKRINDDLKQDEAVRQMMVREAWVLGTLEHPNVVPVHDLLLDPEGEPILTLKRIEGESWHTLMADPVRVREHYGAEDVLEWHLRVLVSVCNAMSFAHSKGILHRDIKPENVMVGRFGEVYVLDWGIAVALRDDGTGRFPLASEVSTLAGTPTYMAPEMLGGRGARLGVHTDVYLLGATLFHLLAGRPPHQGDDVMEIATKLVTEDPVLPEDAPPALAEICNTAMARDVRQRYPSVDLFRQALLDYLRNRDAVLLAEEGEAKLAELTRMAAAEVTDAEAHRLRMFNVYSEARLGFRMAKRIWPRSDQARQGIVRATTTMVEYLLAEGDLASATTLAAQIEGKLPPELARRLEEAKAQDQTQRRRVAQLEALGREHDPTIGRRARFVAYTAVSLQFVVIEVVGHFWRPFETHEGLIVGSLGMCALLALAGLVFRRALLPTTINRQLFLAVVLAFLGKLLIHVSVAVLGHEPWEGHALSGIVYAVLGAAAATFFDARLASAAVGFGGAALVAVTFPEQRYLAYAAAGLVFFLVMLALSLRAERDPAPRRAKGAAEEEQSKDS